MKGASSRQNGLFRVFPSVPAHSRWFSVEIVRCSDVTEMGVHMHMNLIGQKIKKKNDMPTTPGRSPVNGGLKSAALSRVPTNSQKEPQIQKKWLRVH